MRRKVLRVIFLPTVLHEIRCIFEMCEQNLKNSNENEQNKILQVAKKMMGSLLDFSQKKELSLSAYS